MAGHSKWKQIKQKKGVADKKRAAQFARLSKNIMIAAKKGPDADMNAPLRVAIEKAKQANMPKEKIEYAIKKGSRQLEGVLFEEITYEGFGPFGIAIILEAMTDNKNRTSSELRHTLHEYNGSLGTSNSVLWNFDQKGAIHIDLADISTTKEDLELLLIDCGAQDLSYTDHDLIVYTLPNALKAVEDCMKAHEIPMTSSSLAYTPKEWIEISKEEDKEYVLDLYAQLDELDDISQYYTNAKCL